MSDEVPPIISESEFRRLLLRRIGVPDNMIPATLDTATFRRMALQALQGGGGGGDGFSIVAAPATLDDFSMFPGGKKPKSGNFMAMSINTIYSFNPKIDTQWQTTNRSD